MFTHKLYVQPAKNNPKTRSVMLYSKCLRQPYIEESI